MDIQKLLSDEVTECVMSEELLNKDVTVEHTLNARIRKILMFLFVIFVKINLK